MENMDGVLFDAHFLQDSDAKALIHWAVFLIFKDLNDLYNYLEAIGHDVLNSL